MNGYIGRHRSDREPAPFLKISGRYVRQGKHAYPLDRSWAAIEAVHESMNMLLDPPIF